MNLLPSMTTLKTAAWALVALAVANRIPQVRGLIQGNGS